MIKWDRPCYKCLSHYCDLSCKEPAQPQRTWVGLSMEQFEHFTSYVRADVLIEIEEALMEKNT